MSAAQAPFFQVENRLIDQTLPTIGAYPFAVYMVLMRHAGNGDICWPAISTIAETLHISTATVKRSIATLRSHNLIAVDRRNLEGRSNVYRLLSSDGSSHSTRGSSHSTTGISQGAIVVAPTEPLGSSQRATEEYIMKNTQLKNTQEEKGDNAREQLPTEVKGGKVSPPSKTDRKDDVLVGKASNANTPSSVPAVSPTPIDAMIDALAAACMKFVRLVAHYAALKETAEQLVELGFTAEDVTLWRAKCWPDHWKAKKDQPIPTLKDVLDDIGIVKMLPSTVESVGSPYLNDPYFEGRDDHERPNPYAKPVDELPPRDIEYYEQHDPVFNWWHALKGQLEVQLNAPTYASWIKPLHAIGFADENTLVVEAPNKYMREWFEKHIEPACVETYNRMDRRGGNHKKPSIKFAVVVEGDEQYRNGIRAGETMPLTLPERKTKEKVR